MNTNNTHDPTNCLCGATVEERVDGLAELLATSIEIISDRLAVLVDRAIGNAIPTLQTLLSAFMEGEISDEELREQFAEVRRHLAEAWAS